MDCAIQGLWLSKLGSLSRLSCGRFHPRRDEEPQEQHTAGFGRWAALQLQHPPQHRAAAAAGVSLGAGKPRAAPGRAGGAALSLAARQRGQGQGRTGSSPCPAGCSRPPAPPAAPPPPPASRRHFPGRGGKEAGAEGWRCRRVRRAGKAGCRPGAAEVGAAGACVPGVEMAAVTSPRRSGGGSPVPSRPGGGSQERGSGEGGEGSNSCC